MEKSMIREQEYIDNLNAVADVIEYHEDLFDMQYWGDGPLQRIEFRGKDLSCGTTHCIAGWAAVLNGYVPKYLNSWCTVKSTSETPSHLPKDGTAFEIGKAILGLGPAEEQMFLETHLRPEDAVKALREMAKGALYREIIPFPDGGLDDEDEYGYETGYEDEDEDEDA